MCFLFLPFYDNTDNMVHDGWQVERDTLQHAWEQCWASVLHLVFCQNNSDSMLMLVRQHVPILYPIIRFSTRADAICSFLPQPHVPFPFQLCIKGTQCKWGKTQQIFPQLFVANVFLCSKASTVGKRTVFTKINKL